MRILVSYVRLPVNQSQTQEGWDGAEQGRQVARFRYQEFRGLHAEESEVEPIIIEVTRRRSIQCLNNIRIVDAIRGDLPLL